MEYTIKLISKETVAEGTMAFHFEKPEGFTFKAGQNVDMKLLNPTETDEEGNTRTFSLVSSPSEDRLTIATRMRDTAFKRALKNAEAGFEVKINGPMGSFTLHEKVTRPAIMLVGGIGVTPFMSILKDAAERNLLHTIYLFYSNRRPVDAAFFKEIEELSRKNANLTFVPTMTNIDESIEWNGERGYIDQVMVEKYVSDRTDALYYTAGPGAMVAAMRKMLNDAGVSDDDIRTEEFAGY